MECCLAELSKLGDYVNKHDNIFLQEARIAENLFGSLEISVSTGAPRNWGSKMCE